MRSTRVLALFRTFRTYLTILTTVLLYHYDRKFTDLKNFGQKDVFALHDHHFLSLN
ncbi:hypothetical protein M378DRAFT_169143 [Amanita muscaria Koide BX008]|uniref:Uncharacterized protein n=1 Tax=Amanita muscaria (strain Koide BX008) TaxID=946122 RepID=A0A0C2SZF5_AMAMK|nr:hypothetical protein M378DRAFT_169143 [Amanita muscaria Koide BX008]